MLVGGILFVLGPVALFTLSAVIVGACFIGPSLETIIGLDPVLGPDIPIIRDYPRYNPALPLDIEWVTQCYEKVLSLREEIVPQSDISRIFTGNYMYPYLDLYKIKNHFIFNKSYIGIDHEPALYDTYKYFEKLFDWDERSKFTVDLAWYEYTKNNYVHVYEKSLLHKFHINENLCRNVDINNPKNATQQHIVDWYNGWKDVPEYLYLRQIFVSPLQPDVLRLVAYDLTVVSDYYAEAYEAPESEPLTRHHRSINSTLDGIVRGSEVWVRRQFLYADRMEVGALPNPDELFIVYLLKHAAEHMCMPFEEMVTVFSSMTLHGLVDSNDFVISVSKFKNHEFSPNIAFAPDSDVQWPWPNSSEVREMHEQVVFFGGSETDRISSLRALGLNLDQIRINEYGFREMYKYEAGGGYEIYNAGKPPHQPPSNLLFWIVTGLMFSVAVFYGV